MSNKKDDRKMTPEEEFQSYLSQAESGDEQVLFSIGYCYLQGHGTEQNIKEGEAWLKRAADNGGVTTQYFLSVIYRDGQYVEKNEELELKYCKMAAEAGHIAATYNLGNCYYNRGEYELAEEQLIIAAANGLADAQCNLGLLYFNIDTFKDATPRLLDLARSKFWLNIAKQGDCSDPGLVDRALADAKLRLRSLLKKSGESKYDCSAIKSVLEVYFDEDSSGVMPDNGEILARQACILISEDYCEAFGYMAELIEAGYYPSGTKHDIEMLRLTDDLLYEEE